MAHTENAETSDQVKEIMLVKWTLASDIDGTLTGDRESLDRLAVRLRHMRTTGDLFLILSTGRRLEQVVSGFVEEGLPEPDAVLCQVGTEIYRAPIHDHPEPMGAWRDMLLTQYSRNEAESFLKDIEGLVMQPDIFNTDLKASCYLDQCPDPQAAAAEIQRRVKEHGGAYQVIWSSGRDLDILPAASGKGKAIRFLVTHEKLDSDQVVVAGDTGNDSTMFEEFSKGVVVANAKRELLELAAASKNGCIYCAEHPFAAGVEEGLEFFNVLEPSTSTS